MFGFGRKVKKAPAPLWDVRELSAAEYEARDRATLPAEWQDCHIVWKGVYVWDVVTVDGRHARVEFFDFGAPIVSEYVGTFEH